MSDVEATRQFQMLIDQSVRALFTDLMDKVHELVVVSHFSIVRSIYFFIFHKVFIDLIWVSVYVLFEWFKFKKKIFQLIATNWFKLLIVDLSRMEYFCLSST